MASASSKTGQQAAHLVDELPADPRLQLGHAVSSARNRKGWSAKDLASRSREHRQLRVYSIRRGEVYPDDDRLVASPSGAGAKLLAGTEQSRPVGKGRQHSAATGPSSGPERSGGRRCAVSRILLSWTNWLASKGMRLLQDAEEALSNAEPLIASVACKLEPLVGPTAAQGLALAKDCKSHLLHLQNKLRGLRQSVDRLKRDEAAPLGRRRPGTACRRLETMSGSLLTLGYLHHAAPNARRLAMQQGLIRLWCRRNHRRLSKILLRPRPVTALRDEMRARLSDHANALLVVPALHHLTRDGGRSWICLEAFLRRVGLPWWPTGLV